MAVSSRLLVLLLVVCCLFGLVLSAREEKQCQGTSNGLSISADAEYQYNFLRHMYTGCEFVRENLEITFQDELGPGKNFDFLKDIKQVYGYVLLVGNSHHNLSLPNLRLIGGSQLFYQHNIGYSLYVELNYKKGGPGGLRQLGMKSLSDILTGKVYFKNNRDLCFEETIDWARLNPRTSPPVVFDDDKSWNETCPSCDVSCRDPSTGKRHCWGAGPDMCQTRQSLLPSVSQRVGGESQAQQTSKECRLHEDVYRKMLNYVTSVMSDVTKSMKRLRRREKQLRQEMEAALVNMLN